jgi:hypothetical protein
MQTAPTGTVDEIAEGAVVQYPLAERVVALQFTWLPANGQSPAGRPALWDSGWREARVLATAMLQATVKPAAAAQVERWAETTEDRQVLSELAGAGTAGLRRASPGRFLRAVRSWLKSGRERPRLIALLALPSRRPGQNSSTCPGFSAR